MPFYLLFLKPKSKDRRELALIALHLARVRAIGSAGNAPLPRRRCTVGGPTSAWAECTSQNFEDPMESNEPKRLTLALINPNKKWVVKGQQYGLPGWHQKRSDRLAA
jgi:hypothetical protein